jgi:hypothetical protein
MHCLVKVGKKKMKSLLIICLIVLFSQFVVCNLFYFTFNLNFSYIYIIYGTFLLSGFIIIFGLIMGLVGYVLNKYKVKV